jgi:hypothetical protein
MSNFKNITLGVGFHFIGQPGALWGAPEPWHLNIHIHVFVAMEIQCAVRKEKDGPIRNHDNNSGNHSGRNTTCIWGI